MVNKQRHTNDDCFPFCSEKSNKIHLKKPEKRTLHVPLGKDVQTGSDLKLLLLNSEAVDVQTVIRSAPVCTLLSNEGFYTNKSLAALIRLLDVAFHANCSY